MLMRVSVKLAEPQHYIFWSLWACMCAHACMSWTRPSLFARHTTHSAPPSHGCSPTSAAAFLAVPSPWPWLCRYSSLLKCSIHWTGKYVRGYVHACVRVLTSVGGGVIHSPSTACCVPWTCSTAQWLYFQRHLHTASGSLLLTATWCQLHVSVHAQFTQAKYNTALKCLDNSERNFVKPHTQNVRIHFAVFPKWNKVILKMFSALQCPPI